MKKLAALILIIVVSAALFGCSTEKDMADIYSVGLDSFMPLDDGLNDNIEFIAIDTETLTDASKADQAKVLNYFKKYDLPVMDASMDDLKAKGLFDEKTLSLKGLLLKVEKMETTITGNVVIEGSKFRSGLGAIGVKTVLEAKDGKWQVKESEITWIS